jgi:hypothetical protein
MQCARSRSRFLPSFLQGEDHPQTSPPSVLNQLIKINMSVTNKESDIQVRACRLATERGLPQFPAERRPNHSGQRTGGNHLSLRTTV